MCVCAYVCVFLYVCAYLSIYIYYIYINYAAMKLIVLCLWTYCEHIVNMLWKCCEHVVNNLVNMWWNYEYFVIISRTIWWTRGEHVETMSWTFCEHFVNICCTFGEGRRQLLMKDNSRAEGPEPEGAPCFLPLIAWTGTAWKKGAGAAPKKNWEPKPPKICGSCTGW